MDSLDSRPSAGTAEDAPSALAERAASSPADERTVIHLVPHTHWDREWYEPFQSFRMRLVELIDQLLEQMEADEGFAFTLDGQLATVDDYLEVRPENEARLRALIRAGRLAVGPWQILMDEFLVSGETMIRNLQLGWARAVELGGVMGIGYLPDMFGHIAQMPQLLRRAGIDDAVVWRGVPASITRNSFRWAAPDGSEVRAEHLVGGYSNAAYLLAVPDRLGRKLAAYHDLMRGFYGDRSVLAMYGTDHAVPVKGLVGLVRAANEGQQRYAMSIETLTDYLRAARVADGERDGQADGGLPRWVGEMRSSARSNILPGVTSARVHLKAAAARAERRLERYAEPFQALHATTWPQRLLDLAWRRVVDCSAHDSICGCSLDAVVAQVISRYAEAEQIALGLAERAVARMPAAACDWIVANPSPFERQDLVELEAQIAEDCDEVAVELPDGRRWAAQEVSRNRPLLVEHRSAAEEVPLLLERRLHGRELFGRMLNGYRVEATDEGHVLSLLLDDEADPTWLDVEELRAEIEAAVAATDQDEWTVRFVATPRRRVVCLVPAPPLAGAAVRVVPGRGSLPAGLEPVRSEDRQLSNGLVEVSVADDGTLTLRGGGAELQGVGRLVDGGDFGDSYNYAPPTEDTVVERPLAVEVQAGASGPLRAELRVLRTYRWPLGLADGGAGRTKETAEIPVEMAVELRAGEPFVRIALSFENRARDHRLRFHVPLARRDDSSSAEGQFAVVERGRSLEEGHGERALPTFPARGFVDAGGAAVLLDHVLEYELLEGELALTVLRATGLISRNDNPYREEPAGPERAIPGAQCLGQQTVTFAIQPHAGDWVAAGVLREAERYQLPFLAQRAARTRDAEDDVRGPTLGPGLSIEGEGVVLSALIRRDDWLELRIVAEHPSPTRARIAAGIREAREVDLLGRPGAALTVKDGAVELDLGAWEIRTLQLRR